MERDVAVVLSGGAVNGVLMELGFLKRLRESDLWPRVGWIYGTSSGALSGTMAALDRLGRRDDTLVLFSDGVTEAMDPEEDLFGMPRLVKLLTGHNETPLDDLQKLVLEAVENFARGTSQADDLTLLLVRFRAATTAAETEVPGAHTSASAG